MKRIAMMYLKITVWSVLFIPYNHYMANFFRGAT